MDLTRRGFVGVMGSAALARPAVAETSGAREFFFRPEGAWAADFIPLYAQGRFHLFYLHDWRNAKQHGEGTPWYHISTTDFVNFTEHGEALARGTRDEQDLYVFTGSALEAEGKFHIFYTGHNPYFPKQGKQQEAVMHAVSSDLIHWEKAAGEKYLAPREGFEPDDWRDPFVFRNEQTGEYNMLTAARVRTGPSRRRGLTALSTSKDLRTWTYREPFYAPGLYFTHECPDLFRMGEWWYLVFSEFTGDFVTRYVMSKSLKGPWIRPERDTVDGRCFYAAKTASDGRHRYLFGWNATHSDGKDERGWDWGGNLVVHEVVQNADGSLAFRIPATVRDAFRKPGAVQFGANVSVDSPGRFIPKIAGALPARCRIEAQVKFTRGTRNFGFVLRSSDDLEKGYYIRFEPGHRSMVFDSWPRGSADRTERVELRRTFDLEPGRTMPVTILIDGPVCVVYAANQVAMSTRLYDLKTGGWGVFVEDGAASFSSLSIFEQ